MKYKKRDESINTLSDYTYAKIGKRLSDINTYRETYALNNLEKIAHGVKEAVREGKRITVYGDYDVDGITATSILGMVLKDLKANYALKIPKRFSDGYGVYTAFVQNLSTDVLLTVDNGICATEAISVARKKGIKTLVLDHHLPKIEDGRVILPKADVIVDPEALPEGSDFHGYCGAGLAYRLAELLSDNEDLLSKAKAFAAVGTVADIVPLEEENRRIVQEGLRIINGGGGTAGLRSLVGLLNLTGHVTSTDIAFKIAPVINAPGRLHDTGSTTCARALLLEAEKEAIIQTAKVIECNLERKEIVKNALEVVKTDPFDTINFIGGDIPAGCLGLLASRLVSETGKPSFVFITKDGICHGSARTDDEGRNNIKAILDVCGDLMLSYGGHPGAAGFSFREENLEKIHRRLSDYPVAPHEEKLLYDLDVRPNEASMMLYDMGIAEPFGKNLERPVFSMECHFKEGAEYWHAIGDGTHLRLDVAKNLKAIAFGMKERYLKDGCPKDICLYGDLTMNWFRNEKRPQFIISDYEVLR